MSLFRPGDRALIRDVIAAGKALGSPTPRVAVLEAMKEALASWSPETGRAAPARQPE